MEPAAAAVALASAMAAPAAAVSLLSLFTSTLVQPLDIHQPTLDQVKPSQAERGQFVRAFSNEAHGPRSALEPAAAAAVIASAMAAPAAALSLLSLVKNAVA